MRWLVSTLSNANFVTPAEASLAAEYNKSRETLQQDRSDLLVLADQGRQLDGLQQEGLGTEWVVSQVRVCCSWNTVDCLLCSFAIARCCVICAAEDTFGRPGASKVL